MADTLSDALRHAQAQLSTRSPTPRLDAEVLLAHALGKPRAYLYTWPERALTATQGRQFAALLTRRQAGEPVAYLVGRREFWSLPLKVTPATLIPRPETERLVELALRLIPPGQPAHIADIGTGSGAIALAIASERPAVQVIATEFSTAALTVAQDNARGLGIRNVEWRQGDWCAPLADERFALIVSNPPYLADADPHRQQGDVRFEPASALVAGVTGLEAIDVLIGQAPRYLAAGGRLLLEHGCTQGQAVMERLAAAGFTAVTDHADPAGLSRVSQGRWPGGK